MVARQGEAFLKSDLYKIVLIFFLGYFGYDRVSGNQRTVPKLIL